MYHVSRTLWRASGALILLAGLALAPPIAVPANAASSAGCEGGGFVISGLNDGSTVSTDGITTIPASNLGSSFLAGGRYVGFTVVSASFGVEDWTLTGAPNPLDITGNLRTVVFDSKTPDHRGLILTSDVTVERKGTDIVLSRQGPGLTMKIQAKDCANGGVFQMEVERGDATATQFTHILAEGVFYFDNPNFRAREGDVVPFQNTTVTVTPRINFANDSSFEFVGRDSPQVATRVQEQGCVNHTANRAGGTATVRHCGAISRWDVASGGRMGQVMGEDAVEVAPAATRCTQNCQAKDRVRGESVVLGFPFPVPEESRLKPPFPAP
jgi:hypothetical protein